MIESKLSDTGNGKNSDLTSKRINAPLSKGYALGEDDIHNTLLIDNVTNENKNNFDRIHDDLKNSRKCKRRNRLIMIGEAFLIIVLVITLIIVIFHFQKAHHQMEYEIKLKDHQSKALEYRNTQSGDEMKLLKKEIISLKDDFDKTKTGFEISLKDKNEKLKVSKEKSDVLQSGLKDLSIKMVKESNATREKFNKIISELGTKVADKYNEIRLLNESMSIKMVKEVNATKEKFDKIISELRTKLTDKDNELQLLNESMSIKMVKELNATREKFNKLISILETKLTEKDKKLQALTDESQNLKDVLIQREKVLHRLQDDHIIDGNFDDIKRRSKWIRCSVLVMVLSLMYLIGTELY